MEKKYQKTSVGRRDRHDSGAATPYKFGAESAFGTILSDEFLRAGRKPIGGNPED